MLRAGVKPFIAAVMVLSFLFTGVGVAQASWQDILFQGTMEYLYLRQSLLQQHYNENRQILASFKTEYGVSDNEQANRMLDSVMTRLQGAVEAKEEVNPRYSWFVNKREDFNAFCGLGHNISVNAGLVKFLNYNEDETAFVLAHEMVHGQRMHSLSSLPKLVAFSTVAQLYGEKNPNKVSYIMSYIATQQLIANYATMPQEREADQNSFLYAVDAGYNPGAGAAVWAKVMAREGDRRGNFFETVLNPNDHPSNAEREAYFSRRMTEYAGGMVEVSDGVIIVAGNQWLIPAKTEDMPAAERAYFIAGNLARVFHDKQADEKAAVNEDGDIVIGKCRIMTPTGDDGSPAELAQKLNFILNRE